MSTVFWKGYKMVHFVGAGSGAADLITIRGKKLLENADIIIYAGSLVNPELLEYAKDSAEIYNSAKMNLDEVIDVMKQGDTKNIVRLHTGDPCVYGAIREQMDRLDKLGIEYDVCPGVSSFCGAAAALKAEYTLPDVSQTVIITRMEGRTPVPPKEKIHLLASHNATMVIFLSTGLLKELSAELVKGGYSENTPAAIVYKATWKDEKVMRCTVGTLNKTAEKNGIKKTALITVGMKIASIAFTENGAKIVKMLAHEMDVKGYVFEKYKTDGLETFNNVSSLVRDIFKKYNAIVFVGACGIAVRSIAPYVKDKAKDPAVVVVDEKGNFVIPILSGHIGGANDLAEKIASLTSGVAVITTATDINKKFSVDTFAVRNNLHIGDTKLIKEISSRILNDKKVGLYTDYELKNVPDCFEESNEVGICISDDDKKPFRTTLNLMPKNVVLGIGCRKGCETVEESILAFLKVNGVSVYSLFAVATVDIKKNEKGIVEFCEKFDIPLLTFSAETLAAVEGEFTASEFVKKTVGVDNVCERAVCAVGAKITEKKTALNGTALALGRINTEIDFLKG